MPLWSVELRRAFLALAPHSEVAAPLCRAVVEARFSGCMRLREICLASGIASARSSVVEAALTAGVGAGLFEKCGDMEWKLRPVNFDQLAIALEGLALYQEQVHVDETEVDIVLTPPMKPNKLEEALIVQGYVGATLEHTDAIFMHIALKAKKRFVVFNPFFDSTGVESLLFACAATGESVEKILITRFPNGKAVEPLEARMSELRAAEVKLYNYWLPNGSSYETFHAKALLADTNIAYVGSANMTWASLEKAMELGVMLKGKGAKTLANVIGAVLRISKPI